jgi:hypothetical protein
LIIVSVTAIVKINANGPREIRPVPKGIGAVGHDQDGGYLRDQAHRCRHRVHVVGNTGHHEYQRAQHDARYSRIEPGQRVNPGEHADKHRNPTDDGHVTDVRLAAARAIDEIGADSDGSKYEHEGRGQRKGDDQRGHQRTIAHFLVLLLTPDTA